MQDRHPGTGAWPGLRVPAVGRAADLLQLIADVGRPMRIPELVRESGLPRTSTVSLCGALTEERLLVRGADGTYWLGPRLAELGSATRSTRALGLIVGLLVPNRRNAFFGVQIDTLAAIAADQRAQVQVESAEDDPDRQRRQLDRMLTGGVDVILINPVAALGFEDAMERARAQGVPVVAIDAQTAGAHASVTSDNTQAGISAGHFLARVLSGRGSVAIIDGQPITAMADRVAGFRAAMADYPRIAVVGQVRGMHDRAAGRDSALRIFHDQPEIDGIFVINDLTAYGVAEVIIERGLATRIVTVDGSAKAVDQVRAGGPIIATAAQDPARIAREGAHLAAVLRTGGRMMQGTVLLPTRLITTESWLDYEPWG